MFLVENDILDGLACRLPAFMRKGQPSQNRQPNARLHRRQSEGNEQSSEDIVMEIVSWSMVRFFFSFFSFLLYSPHSWPVPPHSQGF
jgi:hypothetical protein